jgi:hypothetical protein
MELIPKAEFFGGPNGMSAIETRPFYFGWHPNRRADRKKPSSSRKSIQALDSSGRRRSVCRSEAQRLAASQVSSFLPSTPSSGFSPRPDSYRRQGQSWIPTALRWLKIKNHHPELLMKPDEAPRCSLPSKLSPETGNASNFSAGLFSVALSTTADRGDFEH